MRAKRIDAHAVIIKSRKPSQKEAALGCLLIRPHGGLLQFFPSEK
jgi:hypothetical protein